MENLVSPEVLVPIIGGILVSYLTWLLKNPLKALSDKIGSRYIVGGVSLVAGILYYIFNTYLPIEFQQNVVNFVYGSMSSAVFIYSFILNKGNKNSET